MGSEVTRKWLSGLFLRRAVVAFLVVAQFVLLLYLFISGTRVSDLISLVMIFISVLVATYLLVRDGSSASKLTWIVLIMLFPLFGGVFYLLVRWQVLPKRVLEIAERDMEKFVNVKGLLPDASAAAVCWAPEHTALIRYLQDFCGFPVYRNSRTKYLTPGERFHESLLVELEKAEKYIFMEHFIMQEGIMWNSVLEVLERKAAQGVLVRVMYDDVGCLLTLPSDYPKQLEAKGIECCVFNPFKPVLSVFHNNRDHRKIVSIDGKVAFTGGNNLADEYINAFEKHGHWKDASLLVEGEAAWGLTMIFLQLWNVMAGVDEELEDYYPWHDESCLVCGKGFVHPYADTPLDNEAVGENVYLRIIAAARDYLYINTPYFIVDDSVVKMLGVAARSGVDVRIVTPGHWDKWAVHKTTQSYYRSLIESGIKVYEYEPGFMHSKTFVSDDIIATVGTVNMDFRSLYLHFENGVVMYGSEAVLEVRDDFLETLEVCKPITLEDCKTGLFMSIFQSLLRLFAPLL